MSKLVLRNCLNRLRELGHAPSGKVKPKGGAYRSGFQRSAGAMFFAFIYFVLAWQLLEGGEASADNRGIFILLFFALIAAVLGAFFAPRISAFIYARSMPGRRHQAGKSRRKFSSQSARHSSAEHASSTVSKSQISRNQEGRTD